MNNNAVYILHNNYNHIANILNSFKIDFRHLEIKENEFFDIIDISLNYGEKFSKLEKMLPDLGLSLKAHSIPRGYPVYHEGVFRVEVQKKELASKSFRELYLNPKNYCTPITLGTNVEGGSFVIDLHKLPNLLIGGVPGSGKSVLLHSIILSLIANKAHLYLVDPKMVEFNCYQNNKQVKMLIHSIEECYELIYNLIDIMNERFQIMKDAGVRNLFEYNLDRPQKKLAPLVVMIDEWADIVLQDNKIQKPLCVIAQKGRAAGISVVLATQRPSSNVISGLIKANFSGRISLRVF